MIFVYYLKPPLIKSKGVPRQENNSILECSSSSPGLPSFLSILHRYGLLYAYSYHLDHVHAATLCILEPITAATTITTTASLSLLSKTTIRAHGLKKTTSLNTKWIPQISVMDHNHNNTSDPTLHKSTYCPRDPTLSFFRSKVRIPIRTTHDTE